MAQSQNSSVYYTEHATSFHGMATYGNVMLGNKAFEFYNERNPEDYIQIPWDEIDRVAASVMFGARRSRVSLSSYTAASRASRSRRETTRRRFGPCVSMSRRRNCCVL